MVIYHSIYFLTVNYYSTDLISRLVNSIQIQANDYRLVVVNNSPEDFAIASLANSNVKVIHSPTNLGFGRGCNLGLHWIYEQNAEASVWIVNPDAYLTPGALEKLDAILCCHPEVSILGTTVLSPEGRVCFNGGKFVAQTGLIAETREANSSPPSPNPVEHSISPNATSYTPTNWVTACSAIVNFKRFQECPYFDPDYFLYYEDFDFCQRYAKQGHVIGITDRISVIHQTSAITSRNPKFKIEHEIFSYLLSLEKHASKFVLLFRLVRIFLVSCAQISIEPQLATSKLRGVWMYCQKRVMNYESRIAN